MQATVRHAQSALAVERGHRYRSKQRDWTGSQKKPSSFERTRNISPFANAPISHACVPHRSAPFQRASRGRKMQTRNKTLVRTRELFEIDALVQTFHLGSDVIPGEMRGSVSTPSFAHRTCKNKVGGQQADG